MSQAVFFFGGFQASQQHVDAWRQSAKQQKPAIDFHAFPWPAGVTKADDRSAIEGFKRHGVRDAVIGDIQGADADTIFIVGHSSGCAIANDVDANLKDTQHIALVSLDGFRPSAAQLDRDTTQVWGAICEGVTSLHFPAMSQRRREVYTATGCKLMWPLHFSLVNTNARDGQVTGTGDGYADCKANLCFL